MNDTKNIGKMKPHIMTWKRKIHEGEDKNNCLRYESGFLIGLLAGLCDNSSVLYNPVLPPVTPMIKHNSNKMTIYKYFIDVVKDIDKYKSEGWFLPFIAFECSDDKYQHIVKTVESRMRKFDEVYNTYEFLWK